MAGFSGEAGTLHHELCGAARFCFPPPGTEQRGCCGGRRGLSEAEGARRARLGAVCNLASTVHSCRARLFRSLLPLRSGAYEAAERASLSPCVTPSSLLSVPPLQLPPSLWQRPQAPVLLPQPPRRRVPRGQTQPSLEDVFSIGKSLATPLFLSAWSKTKLSLASAGIFGLSPPPYPQIWGPWAGFCSSRVSGCSAPLGTPMPPRPPRAGHLPARLGTPGAHSAFGELLLTRLSPGTAAWLKSQRLCQVP